MKHETEALEKRQQTILMNVIHKVILLFEFLRSCQLIAAESKVTPERITNFVGEDINFPCSCLLKDYVSWDQSPVGRKSTLYVHTAKIGIIGKYRYGKKHSVTLNETSGTCDLAIANITVDDAGAYTCTTRNRNRTNYELIVLDSSPTCSSNISLAGVLLENDCNIDPDYIELNCTISYHGNLPPVLEWRQSNIDDVISSSVHHSRSTSALVITHRLTFLPDIKQNGSHFECSLKDNVAPIIQRQHCTTQRISLSYFFSTSETRTMEEFVGDFANVPCSANTSEVCSYRWLATDISTNNTIQISTQSSQTLSLIPKYFEIYNNLRCVAECRIRNKSCTVQPLELCLEILTTIHEQVIDEYLASQVASPIVVVFCIILGISVLLIFFRRRRWIRFDFPRLQLRGDQVSEGSILMNDIVKIEDWQRLFCSPNVLLEELVERQIITLENKNQILKEQRHPPPLNINETILQQWFETVQSKYPSKLANFVTAVKEINNFHGLYVTDDRRTIPLPNEKTEVAGIACLNGTLFVVCFYSSEANIFEILFQHKIQGDSNAREEISWTHLMIKENVNGTVLNDPYGMTASKECNSVFILEGGSSSCLWKIQMPDNIISRHKISGEGRGLSINSSDQLVVLVLGPTKCMLVEKYDPSTLNQLGAPTKLIIGEEVFHIDQTSEDNFLLFQQKKYEKHPGLYILQEVSLNGKKVVRKFDPSECSELNWRDFIVNTEKTYTIRDNKNTATNNIETVNESGAFYDENPFQRLYWYPDHLLIGEHGHVFVVDKTRKGVLLMNKHSLSPKVLISGNMINREFPSRVCYIREHQLLIVGHSSSFESDASPSISIFKLGLRERIRSMSKSQKV